jgi:hypothetical protein
MAADEKPQRISIGFLGGQTLAARVAPAELTNLRNALGSDGWHDLTKVVYVIVDHEEHRVGFGT